tara:strand:- start:2985 stop:3281 length:297 start_codon:yes stop_codon:yes gene_type:complete
MKVKVSYTADYDDVPELVNKLVTECKETLRAASNLKFNIFNLEQSSRLVAQVQKDVDIVASKLEDCLNICHGYQQAGQNQEEALIEEPAQQEVTDEDN